MNTDLAALVFGGKPALEAADRALRASGGSGGKGLGGLSGSGGMGGSGLGADFERFAEAFRGGVVYQVF